MNDFSEMFYNDGNKRNKAAAGFLNLDFIKFKEFFEIPGDVKDEERVTRIQNKLLQLKGKADLEAGTEEERNIKGKMRDNVR